MKALILIGGGLVAGTLFIVVEQLAQRFERFMNGVERQYVTDYLERYGPPER